MRKVLWIAILVLCLAACAPDPRDVAAGYRTQVLADQDAADRIAARKADEDTQALALQAQQAEQPGQVAAHNRLVYWVSVIGTIAVCMVIMAAGGGISWAILGAGKATAMFTVRLAVVRANLISLDPRTRQFPLLLYRKPDGKYTLSNPNVGSTVQLDMKRLEDRQMISSAGAVQFAGMVAHEARLSSDPAGVAVTNAPVIGAEDETLKVGLSVIGDSHE